MRLALMVALSASLLAPAAVVSADEVAQRRIPAPQPIPFPPARSTANQTVTCGMTVLQGDSKIDPAMPRRPPANAPKPTIKIIPPPACRK